MIETLLSRTSVPKLIEPAPQGEALEQLFQAAARAADHGRLRPWRFVVIEGEGLDRFGSLMVDSQREVADIDDELAAKLSKKPHRAPMIVAVICNPKDDPKIPEIEQVISAGAAAQMMVAAAHAQGFAAMWRSGRLMFTETMAAGLGLAPHESLIGFIYLGTSPAGNPKPAPFDSAAFVSHF